MADRMSRSPSDPGGHAVQLPPAEVLVVDDRADQRLALEAALADLPVTVHEAASGSEALRLLLRRNFALVLLDVNMPDLDGFELASLIRNRPRTAHTPVIFITAAADIGDHAARGYSLGAVDYIHAPVVPDVLRAKVSVFVDLHRKSEEVRLKAEALREFEAREHRRELDDAMARLASEARQVEMLREEQRHVLRAQRLATASVAINSTHSVDEMLPAIAAQALVLVGASNAHVWLRDEGHRSRGASVPSRPAGSPDTQTAESAHERLMTTAAASGMPLRLGLRAMSKHPSLWNAISLFPPAARPHGWISVPLAGNDRRTIGVLVVTDRADGEPFDAVDEQLVSSLADVSSVALQEVLFREAREANRMKDEFLAVLSHELRTPLSAMMGWAQLLRSGKLDDNDRTRAVEVIERNLRIQTQLIDELLDMSRIVTGKLRLDPCALPIAPILAGAIDAQRPAAMGKEIQLTASLDAEAACVWGDAGRLEQVVTNLLSNALKFTPRGGRIEVTLQRDGAFAEARFTDSGEGIDPALLPRIFDRFTQAETSTTRARAGLGLGLTIVKRLVELHGGSIEAESAGKGLGACFTVRLPVFDGVPTTPAVAGTETPHPRLDGVRVLVVDDEMDARDLLATALGDAGAKVETADSAAAALVHFDRLAPHLLISDISMPEEDGYSLMKRVRRRSVDRGGAVPAIALTALAEHRDRIAALAAGYQIHLAKPVNLEQLLLAAAALAPAPAVRLERIGIERASVTVPAESVDPAAFAVSEPLHGSASATPPRKKRTTKQRPRF
jgi:signal transduction histidine kinase/DNA-binding response OmpR family regulator